MRTPGKTTASHLRSTIGWLRQMKAALEIPAPQMDRNGDERARQLDREVSRLRAFGIDPRI
jgi:hypothetical protein